ncbi:hypothetical protein LSUE1_G007676 [Lachnellula suecica]|uniref:Yeast cell wall synthesis Kre9/Knh1-like N-terminal domain-containing protein n=1 Tax=Lachnellula suecica TaxID=602035 RepID=A0A8T9C8V9_9HELO|nr:hypothetical protein LSUE1_G007676 [Lachnellula suecica]
MRFSQTLVALTAFTSSAFAQTYEATPGFDAISNPSAADQTLTPGSSFEITWEPATFKDSQVAIILLAGETPASLQPAVDPITTVTNSDAKYTWTVPSSTATTYGFKIALNSTVFQYSFPFHISGGSSSSSSSTASESSTASSSVSGSTSASSVTPTTLKTAIAQTTSANSTTISSSTIVAPLSTGTGASSASANVTLQSTVGATKSSAAATQTTVVGATTAASTATSASTSLATPTGNAAVSNVAQGGLAVIGGLVLAFAL